MVLCRTQIQDGNTGDFNFGFTAVHNMPPPRFGGNPLCAFHAQLNAITLNGPWTFTCTGGPAPHAPFTRSGTLTFKTPYAPQPRKRKHSSALWLGNNHVRERRGLKVPPSYDHAQTCERAVKT